MLSSKRKVRLGDYVVHQKGFAFKSSQYTSVGHPIIRVSNFTDRSVDISDLYFISTDSIQQYDKFKVRYFDVVIATVGSWPKNPASIVGKTICIPQECEGALLNQNAVILRGTNELEQKYLFYLLKTREFQEYIVSKAQGSANQASITLDDIFGFEFELPTLEQQNFIICQLRALDEKIELNQKMNETLEAMAQALFKSWFVNFEGVSAEDMRESEMGLIPKKWRVGRLEELADVVGGGTPSTSEKKFYCNPGAGISWLSPKDLSGYSWKYISQGATDITELGLNKSSARMLPKGTVLFSSRAPIGYIAIAEKEVCTNQGFKSLIPKNGSNSEFLYYLIKENIDLIESSASGSTFKEISGSGMKELSVICPPEVLMISFKKTVSDFFERQKELRHETNSLIKIRDFLLPKLISGQLRLKNAEKFLESHI